MHSHMIELLYNGMLESKNKITLATYRGCVNIFDTMLTSWSATSTGRKVGTINNAVAAAAAALKK
jgi:hypothetical protein